MSLWGDIIGGGLSYLGSQQNASAATEAAQLQANSVNQAAAAAQAAAVPWSTGSLGGTATFNEDNRSSLLNLSPELQNIYAGGLERSGLWGQQANQLGADPFAAQENFYQQQQQYYQPEEDKLRTDAETRLLAQGRLGGTGGQAQLQGLEEGIARGQMSRRNAAMSQSQGLIDSLLGRESADIGQSTGLLNIPMQMANLGRGIGGTLGSAAAYGLSSRAAAAGNLSNVMNAGGTGMGNALSAAGGLFQQHWSPSGGSNFQQPNNGGGVYPGINMAK